MPPAGARGAAGGHALTAGFRCAAASLERDEPLAGSASTVRAFLLLEDPGPWGVDALRDSRLPADVLVPLRQRCAAAGVRPLLVRRPDRAHRREPDAPRTVLAAYAGRDGSWLETGAVDRVEEVLALDLEALGAGSSVGLARQHEPVVAVCTHGRHDACCAERGRPVAQALLAAGRPDLVWEVSHIGGDRFAANVLVLPHGLYYGRVDPDEAADLLAASLRGEVVPSLLRGRSTSPFPAQVAEAELRRRLGETRLDAVRLVSCRTRDDVSVVVHEVAGRQHRTEVRRTAGEPVRLTCRAVRDNAPPVWSL